LQDIVRGVQLLLKNDGVFVFEVTYLKANIEKGLFDMQYLEHVFTESIKPLKLFFESLNMVLFDVELVNTHGGSIRCFVKKEWGKHEVAKNVEKFINEEEQFGLYKKETYTEFYNNILKKKKELSKKLNEYKDKGEKVWAYGAPAKLTTFFNVMGLNGDLIEKVVDDSPAKQNKFTPQYS
jgi:hypothetical protein